MVQVHSVDPGVLAERGAHAPAHLRPILAAIRDHGAIFGVIPQSRKAFKVPAHTGRPVIVIIGDDLHEALGPQGFHTKSLRRAISGACGLVIVSSGAEVAPYAGAAALAALTGGKTAIVETQPEWELAWLEFARRHAPDAPVLISTPNPEAARQADECARMQEAAQ